MKNVIVALTLVLYSLSALAQFREKSMMDNSSPLDYYSDITGLDLRIHSSLETGPRKFGPSYNKNTQNGYFVPFELSKGDMATIAAASAVAVMFFANDREVMDFAQSHKNEVTMNLATIGEGIGSEWGAGAVAAGVIIGVVMQNDEVKSVSLMAAKTLLVAGLANYAMKQTFHRDRPRENVDPYVFSGPSLEHDHVSFPSGHTTQAFALATVIAEATKDKSVVIPILAYSAAALTAYSRVHDNAHWASDVIVGGLLGHVIAKAMMNKDLAEKGFYIVPTFDFNGGYGINVTYTGRVREESCAKGLSQNEALRVCIEQAFEKKKFSLFR